ncbi:MAG: DUF805 domain-containing protein [Aureispira sp.]|nr:DUF805 domain-containing protein [Aureispira sp.]
MIIENYKICLQKYADFSGRASRSEFWSFALVNIIVLVLLILGTVVVVDSVLEENFIAGIGGFYILGMFLPSIAVGARRMHDIGRSGWLQFIYMVPLGPFVLIVFYSLPGEIQRNQYGRNPLNLEDDDEYDMLEHLIE